MTGTTRRTGAKLSDQDLERLLSDRGPRVSPTSSRKAASGPSLAWNRKGWHSLSPDERAHLQAILPASLLAAFLAWATGKPQAFLLFYPFCLLSARKGIDMTEFPATPYHERTFAGLPGAPETGLLRGALLVSSLAAAVLPTVFIVFLVMRFASK